MKPALRVSGHTLTREGEPHMCGRVECCQSNKTGVTYTTKMGHALCSCGDMSTRLISNGERKRWHRAHKQAVKDRQSVRRLVGCTGCGSHWWATGPVDAGPGYDYDAIQCQCAIGSEPEFIFIEGQRHFPVRGDDVETWLRVWRGRYGQQYLDAFQVIDALLDDYRLHADTGASLYETVSEH